MDAILLAGGRIRGVFAEQQGVTLKALLKLEGKTLLERGVEALRWSRRVGRVCVVGPRSIADMALVAGADVFAVEARTGIDNLMRGVRAVRPKDKVLCSASDLPFITPSDVDSAIDAASSEAAVACIVFSRQEWQTAFPDGHSTFIPFSDGEFVGGCVYILDPLLLNRIEPVVRKAFEARKSPVAMAGLLGPALLVRFVMGRYIHRSLGPSTEQVRKRAEAILRCRAAVIRGCSPSLAADVDDLRDWEYVRRCARCA